MGIQKSVKLLKLGTHTRFAQSQNSKLKSQKKLIVKKVRKMERITERTFKFASRIYKLCKKLQELDDYTDKLLAGQLFRAGTSIGAIIFN